MQRKENWPEILHACIQKASIEPFEFGINDCCLFAANVINEMTEIDFAKAFRGKYNDAKTAAKALRKIGKGSLLKTITYIMCELHCKSISAAQAKRGDLAYTVIEAETGKVPALGIVTGTHVAFVGDKLVYVSVLDIKKVWSCG